MDDAVRNIILFACEDMDAVRHIAEVIDDHPEYAAEKETIKVVVRALGDISKDLRDAVGIKKDPA